VLQRRHGAAPAPKLIPARAEARGAVYGRVDNDLKDEVPFNGARRPGACSIKARAKTTEMERFPAGPRLHFR
jgi:hypothetical protein